MGAVTFSLDPRLVDALQSNLSLSVLVETGTFKGDTIANFETSFDRLVSIELSDSLCTDAAKRFELFPKVQILQGNSPDKLRELRSELQSVGVLYWLDAHWCIAADTAGERSQCPLLEELQAIEKLHNNSVVLIDDARLFLAPPLAPHEISQWPSLHQIITRLFTLNSEYELMVVNDVIVFYPSSLSDVMIEYARVEGVDLLKMSSKVRDYDNLRSQFNDLNSQCAEKELILIGLYGELVEKEKVIQELKLAYDSTMERLLFLEGKGDPAHVSP